VQIEDERFSSVAISLGPVAPYPFRAGRAEAWLVGRPATANSIDRAAARAQDEANPRESLLRCGKAYRQAMVAVLARSTLNRAVAAALGAGDSL
jgi:carbon-monoxide dehydrogenase medium subunit